jgi:hypothetical protein
MEANQLPTKPEPLYPCHFCNDEYSWPAPDLHWSNRFSDWVCGECWCGNCHDDDDYEPDEMGVRLSDYLQDVKNKELAAPRRSEVLELLRLVDECQKTDTQQFHNALFSNLWDYAQKLKEEMTDE